MDKEKVLNLAKLARISISVEEAEKLSGEFDSILNYVSEVKKAGDVSDTKIKEDYPVRNVLRSDGNPHESGMHTEKILSGAPYREGDYIKVKKIL